jgi:hypothetical protein
MPLIITRPQSLGFGEAIGSLLSAIIDAQAQSARATVDFVNAVGFRAGVTSQPETLRTVKFLYTKLDENQRPAEFAVEIPLLAMVEIPLVSVKKASIQFKYEVTRSEAAPTGGRPGLPGIAAPPRLAGRVADVRPGSQERANLDVTIELEKSLMPVGLDKVLDILELAVTQSKQPAQP